METEQDGSRGKITLEKPYWLVYIDFRSEKYTHTHREAYTVCAYQTYVRVYIYTYIIHT